ncbi:MAG: hypothetical protein HYX24_05945 [Candidatus Aenigmarchaeota archaeon]|nr:hypothetical protein [Candidatus Aenigmarchaeota archaeon]
MKQYLLTQVFTIAISLLLFIVFYIVLAANAISGKPFISEMILIVIAIILLAIYASLRKLEYFAETGVKGGKK